MTADRLSHHKCVVQIMSENRWSDLHAFKNAQSKLNRKLRNLKAPASQNTVCSQFELALIA